MFEWQLRKAHSENTVGYSVLWEVCELYAGCFVCYDSIIIRTNVRVNVYLRN